MSHPIYLVRRFQQRVDDGHYRTIGNEAADKYRTELAFVDPYERLAQVYATKSRLIDKLALVREIVGMAVGVADLSDDDMLAVLVGWAATTRVTFEEASDV